VHFLLLKYGIVREAAGLQCTSIKTGPVTGKYIPLPSFSVILKKRIAGMKSLFTIYSVTFMVEFQQYCKVITMRQQRNMNLFFEVHYHSWFFVFKFSHLQGMQTTIV
jgi:hypothetical protein